MPFVRFFTEGIKFKIKHPRKTTSWIKESILAEGYVLSELNFIFCSDEQLRSINLKYLQHATYTDILTFDTSEDRTSITGDIFISVDRVKENSVTFKTAFDTELHRVMIHGVLHLLGYSDKTAGKKAMMRKKEDAYLSLRQEH